MSASLDHIRSLNIPSYGDDEIEFMADTLLDVWPDHVFDYGTNWGASARVFHELCVFNGCDATIHTIELPDDVTHREHPGTTRYAKEIEGIDAILRYRGDGATEAVRLCDELQPDAALFFVDGDHETESVYRELCMVAPYALDGAILVHDTRQEHTMRGVELFLDVSPLDWGHEFLGSQAGMSRLWL